MTITVQVAGPRQSLASAEPQQVSDFIALTTPSKVLVDISPNDIVAMTREGSSLVVERVGGDPLEVLGFFANGAGQSQLYVPGEEGRVLLASMTAAPGSDSLSTLFVEASDDSMRFDPETVLASADESPASDWWEEDANVEETVAPAVVAQSTRTPSAAGDDFRIDEVFQEGVGEESALPSEEMAQMATADGGGADWLSGIGPDLLGFIGFGVALAAHRATYSSSSSSPGDEGNDDESVSEVTESAPVEEEEELLLQTEEDLLLVEGDEGASEAAMAMPPQEAGGAEGVAEMPALVGLGSTLITADDPSLVGGQEIVS